MAKSKENLTFENAVERLEKIVAQLESAELPLDSVIEQYEEGMKLLSFCGEKLAAAEQKIELLTRGKDGGLQRGLLDADGDASADSEPPPVKKAAPRKDNGEIALF